MAETLAKYRLAFDADVIDGGDAFLRNIDTEVRSSKTDCLLQPEHPEHRVVCGAVSELIADILTLESYGLCLRRVALPLHKDRGDKLVIDAHCSIYVSDNFATADTVLLLCKGKFSGPAGHWGPVCTMINGLKIGSVIPYVLKAKDLGWGVIVFDPNTNVLVTNPQGMPSRNDQNAAADAEDSSNCTAAATSRTVSTTVMGVGANCDGGPAPQSLIAGICDFGFSTNAAHRAVIGSASLDIEDCANWLMAQGALSEGTREDAISQLDAPLTVLEQQTKATPVPHNETPVAHTVYVFDTFVSADVCAATNIVFAGTSYGGHCLAQLVEQRPEIVGRLRAVALSDSSHFIDCHNGVSEVTAAVLREKSVNFVPSKETTKGCSTGETRLHSPCVSAGDCEHSDVPGIMVNETFDFFIHKLSS